MIVTKASELNDTSFGKIQAPIKQYLESQDLLALENTIYDQVIPVVTSGDWAESYGGQTSLSNRMQPKGENAAYPESDVQDMYTKILENAITWKDSVSFSKEMIEDGKLGAIKDEAGTLVDNYYDTMEEYAADFFTKAISTTQLFEGKTFNIAGADAKALFATDHPSKTGGFADQSNLYNAAFSNENLTKLEAILSNQRDDNGRKLRLRPDTIIVPFTTAADAAQRELVFEALNATGNPTSTDRAGIYNAKRYNVISWNFLGEPAGKTGSTSWWMLADMKYIMKNKPFVLQKRIDLEINSCIDTNTDANQWRARARHVASPTNSFRGIVACIPGLGTSL
jgi:hypothetical protein